MANETMCSAGCVDVTTDDKNCGSCDHSCQGGACTNGQCQPVELANGLRSPNDIATDGTNVYWTAWSAAFGGVFSVPVNGGALNQLTTTSDTYGITTDGTNIYYTQYLTSGSVYNVPTGGGSPVLMAMGQGRPTSVSAAGGYVFFANPYTGNISKSLNDGSTNVTVVAASQGAPPGVVADDSYVYWTCGCTSTTSGISRAPIGGGAPAVLAMNQAFPLNITMDANNVYWTNQGSTMMGDGSVMMAAKSGAQVLTVATAQDKPYDIAVNDKYIYWTTNVAGGSVMAAPLGGGTPIVLVSGQNYPRGITTDAVAIYWTNAGTGTDGSIMKLAK